MKYQTTKRNMLRDNLCLEDVGYKLLPLFACDAPESYTCGIYGWNADCYRLRGNTYVVTGYRPFGNIKIDSEFADSLCERAREINETYRWEYEQKKEKLQALKDELCQYINNN